METAYSLEIYQALSIERTKEVGFRILFWLKGESDVHINFQKFKYKSGDLLVITPRDTFDIVSNDDTVVCLMTLNAQHINKFIDVYDSRIANQLPFQNARKIGDLLYRLLKLEQHQREDWETKRKILWYICFELEVSQRRYEAQHVAPVRQSFCIEEVDKYLEANHRKKLKVKDVATRFSTTEKAVSALFKSTRMKTMTRYMREIRLNHCLKDVLDTDEKIANIALEHGFMNVSHFIDLFRESYGDTPGNLRKGTRPLHIVKHQSKRLPISNAVMAMWPRGHGRYHTEPRTIDLDAYQHVAGQSVTEATYYIEETYQTVMTNHDMDDVRHALSIKKHKHINLVLKGALQAFLMLEADYTRDTWMKRLLYRIEGLYVDPVFEYECDHQKVIQQHEREQFITFLKAYFKHSRFFKQHTLKFKLINPTVRYINQFKQLLALYVDHFEVLITFQTDHHYEENDLLRMVDMVDGIVLTPLRYYSTAIQEIIPQHKRIAHFSEYYPNVIDAGGQLHIRPTLSTLTNKYLHCNHYYFDYNTYVSYMKTRLYSEVPHFIQTFMPLLHQLRGHVIYHDHQILITKYKMEYQIFVANNQPQQDTDTTSASWIDIHLPIDVACTMCHVEKMYVITNESANEIETRDFIFDSEKQFETTSYELNVLEPVRLPEVGLVHMTILTQQAYQKQEGDEL